MNLLAHPVFVCKFYVSHNFTCQVILASIFGTLSDLHSIFFKHRLTISLDLAFNVCKNLLTYANFHWSSIFHLYSWQTSQVSETFKHYWEQVSKNHYRSVKSYKHCWEQVRKNHHGSVKSSKYCWKQVRITIPQIEARMINLPAELEWVSENVPL